MTLINTYAELFIPAFLIGNFISPLLNKLSLTFLKKLLDYVAFGLCLIAAYFAAKHLWMAGFSNHLTGYLSVGFLILAFLMLCTVFTARFILGKYAEEVKALPTNPLARSDYLRSFPSGSGFVRLNFVVGQIVLINGLLSIAMMVFLVIHYL